MWPIGVGEKKFSIKWPWLCWSSCCHSCPLSEMVLGFRSSNKSFIFMWTCHYNKSEHEEKWALAELPEVLKGCCCTYACKKTWMRTWGAILFLFNAVPWTTRLPRSPLLSKPSRQWNHLVDATLGYFLLQTIKMDTIIRFSSLKRFRINKLELTRYNFDHQFTWLF